MNFEPLDSHPCEAPLAGRLAAVLFIVLASILLLAPRAFADTAIGEFGTGAGQLLDPHGVARSAATGDLYVADFGNYRIDQFDPAKSPADQFVHAFGWGVASGAAQFEVCTTTCQTGSFGSGPGQPWGVNAVAVDNSCAEQEPPLTEATTPTCAEFDPSYGDLYVTEEHNLRVEKFSTTGEFLLMFGGEVDKTTGADLCTSDDLEAGDTCGAGVPGSGPAHFYQGSADIESESWGRNGNNSLAVGPDGTVYVGDYGRIQEFNPKGEFTGEFRLPDDEPDFVSALAVDSAGDVFERSATYGNVEGLRGLIRQAAGVREWSPAHALLRTFDAAAGSEPTHIALDAAGDLFLADMNSGDFQFRAYKPGGTLYAIFTSDRATPVQYLANVGGLAAGDPSGDLYVSYSFGEGQTHHIAVHPLPQPGPPGVGNLHVTDVEPETAILHAVVDPRQSDTTYRFQWVTQKHFEEEGFSNPGHNEPVDLGPISREVPVSAPISPLTPGTEYRYRIIATNSDGTEEEEAAFQSLPPTAVRDFTTQIVAPEEVTLKAEASPDNSLSSTHWQICYGEDKTYSGGCAEGDLHVHGNEFEALTANFGGLRPNTTYHYRFSADNQYGPVKTPDQTFTTEETLAEQDAREGCTNSLLREENNSLALPDCRAYEQASAVHKEGGEATGPLLAPGGGRATYLSVGVFAGAGLNEVAAEYLAQRTSAGWQSQALIHRLAPLGTEPVATQFPLNGGDTASPELDRWIFAEIPGPDNEVAKNRTLSAYFSLGLADGSYVLHATPTLSLLEGGEENSIYERWAIPFAASSDLSRVFIATTARLLPSSEDPRLDDRQTYNAGNTRLYEISGVGGPTPSLSLVAEVPRALTERATCRLDDRERQGIRLARYVSDDGAHVFYTAPVQLSSENLCGPESANPIGIFSRTETAPPVRLDAPPPAQCHSPSPCASDSSAGDFYLGASPDGSLAWFSTARPLIDSDTDSTPDLYLARLTAGGELEALVQASRGETGTGLAEGDGASVQGFLGLSPDGSHAAFVARGALTAQPNAAGESARSGADNLYVYDARTGRTAFVADLCSGPEETGSLPDPSCPAGLDRTEAEGANNDDRLWLPSGAHDPEVHFTPDGDYLLFASRGRLAPGDTDTVADVYRFDLATGQLIRISFGHRGNDANGNDERFPAEVRRTNQYSADPSEGAEDRSRAISANGSTVVFSTAASLVSRDTDLGANPGCGGNRETGCDVYQWEEDGHGTCTEPEGCISLLSSGVVVTGASAPVISSSGRDVVFQTDAGLAPVDTDGVPDIYDARVEGGFPYVPPPQTPVCVHGSAEACHGESTIESLPVNPASETLQGGGSGPRGIHCAKGRHKVKKHGQVRCVTNKPQHHHHKRKRHKRARLNRGGGR